MSYVALTVHLEAKFQNITGYYMYTVLYSSISLFQGIACYYIYSVLYSCVLVTTYIMSYIAQSVNLEANF